MTKFKLATSLVGAFLLTACSSNAPSAVDQAANATCPANKILSDISTYSADLPAASLDTAAWLAANADRDGVKTTASGLQYSVVQKGIAKGPTPVGSQMIKVNYHGFFPDGQVFDSSYERNEPISFPANGVIKGWIEALGGMKPCEARILYIPGDLAYGPQGRPGIPPNATLLFYVQLLGVEQ